MTGGSIVRWGSLLGPSADGTVDLRLRLGARGDELALDLSRRLSDTDLSFAQLACGRLRSAIASAEFAGVDWRRRYDSSFPTWMVAEARLSLLPLLTAEERPDERQMTALQRLFRKSEWEGCAVFPDDDAPHAFRKKLAEHTRAGRIHPLIEVLPGDTGRLATRPGSFQVMSWPRGPARRCLVSSFIRGRVVSFDFNAMDARSLLSLSEELRETFRGDGSGGDMYAALANRCFGRTDISSVERRFVKDSFLRLSYGASDEALAEEFAVPPASIAEVRRLFEPVLSRMPVRGQRLALFGQAASSEAFRAALAAANDYIVGNGLASFALFPVHDELLADFDERELGHVRPLADAMARAAALARDGFPYRVKIKVGQNYDQMEEKT